MHMMNTAKFGVCSIIEGMKEKEFWVDNIICLWSLTLALQLQRCQVATKLEKYSIHAQLNSRKCLLINYFSIL